MPYENPIALQLSLQVAFGNSEQFVPLGIWAKSEKDKIPALLELAAKASYPRVHVIFDFQGRFK